MDKGFYHMTTEDRTALLTAADSTEVPIKLRNKLYVALGRLVKQGTKNISAEFIAKWKLAEDEGNESKFVFLQSWAQDTSGAVVLLNEKFSTSVAETDEVAFAWATKFDLYALKNAYPTLCKWPFATSSWPSQRPGRTTTRSTAKTQQQQPKPIMLQLIIKTKIKLT